MIILEQLKLLVNLACIDGELQAQERQYIINIGKAHGLSAAEVGSLISQAQEGIISPSLTSDERFSYIFSLVELMKIDGRLYKEEIKFCAHIGSRLGYGSDAMFELLPKVKAGMDEPAKQALKDSILHHFRKGRE